MDASGLPITQLGSTIKAHLGIAEKYEGKAEEHYKSAGIHLMEAKARIAAGEYEGFFGKFLSLECNHLSSSRAYELIAIANGTKTYEEVKARHAAYRQETKERDAAVRSRAESTEPQSNQPLSASESAESPTEPKRKRGGQPAAPKTQQDILYQQYVKAGKGLTVEQLQAALQFIKATQRGSPRRPRASTGGHSARAPA